MKFFHIGWASYSNYDKDYMQSLVNSLFKDILSHSSALAILLTVLPLHTFCFDMKKKDLRENGQNTDQEINGSININTDENVGGDQHLNEPVTEESEIEKLREQVEELNDKYLRQAAEFDNFKRRNAKERME